MECVIVVGAGLEAKALYLSASGDLPPGTRSEAEPADYSNACPWQVLEYGLSLREYIQHVEYDQYLAALYDEAFQEPD